MNMIQFIMVCKQKMYFNKNFRLNLSVWLLTLENKKLCFKYLKTFFTNNSKLIKSFINNIVMQRQNEIIPFGKTL